MQAHERTPLHRRIRLARLRSGYSQERFAEVLGTSRRHVMRWEKEGGTKPSAYYRRRIAEVTGEPEETFEDDEDEEADSMALDLYRALQDIVRQELSRA